MDEKLVAMIGHQVAVSEVALKACWDVATLILSLIVKILSWSPHLGGRGGNLQVQLP